MSFSRHSSTENFGGGRRSGSLASNSSSRLSCPVKSWMGLMSLNASDRPRSRNHWNESRWMAMRSGRGRTSWRLAKENRSGLLDRAGNGLLLPGAGSVAGRGGGRHDAGPQRCGPPVPVPRAVGRAHQGTPEGRAARRERARHSGLGDRGGARTGHGNRTAYARARRCATPRLPRTGYGCDGVPSSTRAQLSPAGPVATWPRDRPRRNRLRLTAGGRRLLDLDSGPGRLELGPGLLGLVLGDLLEQRLRRAVDQVLGLLEAQVGQGADLLDDLDLLVPRRSEHDVELGLFLLGAGCLLRAGGAGHSRHRHRCRCSDAEALLEQLHELRQLEDGEIGDPVEDLFLGQCHGDLCSLFFWVLLGSAGSWAWSWGGSGRGAAEGWTGPPGRVSRPPARPAPSGRTRGCAAGPEEARQGGERRRHGTGHLRQQDLARREVRQ